MPSQSKPPSGGDVMTSDGAEASGRSAPAATTSPPATPAADVAAPQGAVAPGTSAPSRVTPTDVADIVRGTGAGGAPTLQPPRLRAGGAATEETLGAVTGTWRTNQYVDATWSIEETRNAWLLLRDVGWRKVFNGRDGAFAALLFLAAQARQTGRPCSMREEPDGMIYEIYLW